MDLSGWQSKCITEHINIENGVWIKEYPNDEQ
jgi:hypothetical protein